jgi:hypothetical protein
MDVVNADIAGANICPCSRYLHLTAMDGENAATQDHRSGRGPVDKASAPRQLLLRCSTSCIHAVVLTLLTYILVGNKKPA